jgi:hypothetical protein
MTPRNKMTTREMMQNQAFMLEFVMWSKYSHARNMKITIKITEEYLTTTPTMRATATSKIKPNHPPDPNSNSKNKVSISDMVFSSIDT